MAIQAARVKDMLAALEQGKPRHRVAAFLNMYHHDSCTNRSPYLVPLVHIQYRI